MREGIQGQESKLLQPLKLQRYCGVCRVSHKSIYILKNRVSLTYGNTEEPQEDGKYMHLLRVDRAKLLS